MRTCGRGWFDGERVAVDSANSRFGVWVRWVLNRARQGAGAGAEEVVVDIGCWGVAQEGRGTGGLMLRRRDGLMMENGGTVSSESVEWRADSCRCDRPSRSIRV